ncbi:unnamed protein product [Camellia sinensis]
MQKAWFYEEHGPKEVLKFGDFPIPIPRHNQLLVPIEFPVVPGCDMAGVVVSKGSGVSKFEVGDKVYGNIQDSNVDEKLKQFGTLAEFIVVEENLVAMKPENVSFEEAASLPLAVQTAMEGFKTANFKEKQTVFIVGWAGGVGTLAVQLAKQFYRASHVVATTSTPKVEFVKKLGADKVVDYRKTRYEEVEEKFDLLYDTIGKGRKIKGREKIPNSKFV